MSKTIEAGTFGNVYNGSSLETIAGSIAEQQQNFKGADHTLLWKPKLRIQDIYESQENQRAFSRLLHHCSCCSTDQEIIAGIDANDRLAIKGLGPAVANLLYFLHPTLMPPFNTTIVKRLQCGHGFEGEARSLGPISRDAGELEKHRDAITRLGTGMKGMQAISRIL